MITNIIKKIKENFIKKPIYNQLIDKFAELNLVKKVKNRYVFDKEFEKALSVLDETNYKVIWNNLDLDNKLGKLISKISEYEKLKEDEVKKGILFNIKGVIEFNEIIDNKPDYIG